jgi:hypothetical protein
MGGSDLIGPLFFGLLFLFLFFLAGRGAKKKDAHLVESPKKKRPLPPTQKTLSHPVRIREGKKERAPSFKKKTSSVLQEGWNTRKSLKQAFILSEVFRRYDER